MRLAALPPARLSPASLALHNDMTRVIAEYLKGFVSQQSDGALIGPFLPMLRFPQFGAPAWEYTKALIQHATLQKPVREVAILVTGARFNSRYELYAHEHVAKNAGLSAEKISTIAAGQRPIDLTAHEAIAYDMASVLADGMQLPGSTYHAALQAFGEQGTAELIYLVGCYTLVSVLLNAFDMPVPDLAASMD